MKLIIVESPTKAKTLSKFLSKDYAISSSFGHIRDLPKKDIGVDIEKNYTPSYEVPSDKKKVIRELKSLVKKSDDIILATDEDREGEAIAWHLAEVLGLPSTDTKRIVFHEITKNAILKALEKPRTINEDLVDAQQARRVIDRLVGYELSPLLWKKVKPGLSAGRVQSVAVRLITEREREIMAFEPQTFFTVNADFLISEDDKTLLQATLNKKLKSLDEVKAFLDACKDASFTISDIQVKDAKKTSSAPFTTSTLQQEASRKLGFSVARTMMHAQKLYENGHITYMRTDSVNLSEQALSQAKSVIASEYGDTYLGIKNYTTKSSSAQEAHEAIRPTDLSKKSAGSTQDEKRLYDLIWKRTLASQMADAKLEKTNVTISVSTREETFGAQGEVIKFDGFLRVYQEGKDDEEELKGILPPLTNGQTLMRDLIFARQSFSRPPARFTEASLVKKLEELGIGRPSTYAPTISTVQKRGYISKEVREGTPREYEVLSLKEDTISQETKTEITGAEKNKLYPTDLALVVTDYLVEHFPTVLDYGFTADIEEQFDHIAEGKENWTQVVDGLYKPFHEKLEYNLKESPRASGERELGTDPKSGRVVIARLGRFGPMVQLGTQEEEDKRFAKLLPTQRLETITLEEALELFKLPRVLGEFEEKEVKANIGRFGPYVMHNSKFVSIKDPLDPYTITLDEAIELIQEKRKADAEKFIAEFPDEQISILKGRYGPYIKHGRKNYKIPKDVDPESLTLEDCLKIIAEAPEKKPRKKK